MPRNQATPAFPLPARQCSLYHLKKKYIPMDKVHSTQDWLDRDQVRYYVGRKKFPAIHVDFVDGKYFIRNGHHRAVAASLKGRTRILAKVLETTDLMMSVLLTAAGRLLTSPQDASAVCRHSSPR